MLLLPPRKLLGISFAALAFVQAPAALASLIPNLTVIGLVSGGANFTYSTVLSTNEAGTFPSLNTLTLSGGALGPTTSLVSETGFLSGFSFSTSVVTACVRLWC